ncbi:DUF397 domain-containing protein [Streptomyces sp. NPDC051776]|uniref:DUF397 domain-containing protein n=1 Tax=Streptomyces sp. NPDC051776 TaxID=3155414 RepID=UPI00341BEF23
MLSRQPSLTEWTKSSYSAVNGDCVEVKETSRAVSVRDSKDPQGPVLDFAPEMWTDFILEVGRGSFGAV